MSDALDRVLKRRGLAGGPAEPPSVEPARDITAPAVPVQEEPDVLAAAQKLRATARDAFSPSDPGVGSDIRAAELTENAVGRPEPLEPELSLLEQARRAYSPKVLTPDRRPPPGWNESLGERAKLTEDVPLIGGTKAAGVGRDVVLALPEVGAQVAKATGYTPAKLPDSPNPLELGKAALSNMAQTFGWNPERGEGIAEAAAKGDVTVDEESEGIPIENTALALMRMLGSTISGGLQETAGRAPIPDAFARPYIKNALGGDPDDPIGENGWTLSEMITGAPHSAQQRVRRDNPVSDWAQGVLERVEDGRGLEGDFALAAKNRLGPEYENAGWWTGLAIDTLTNWEGMVAKPLGMAGKAAQVTSRLNAADPAGSVMRHALDAIRENEVSAMESIGGRLADELAAGRMTVDQLPPYWRARVDEVALNEHGMTFRELLDADGLDGGKATGTDEAFVEGASDLATARAEAVAESAARRAPAVEPAPAPGVRVTPGTQVQAPAPTATKPVTADKIRARLDKARQDVADAQKLVTESEKRLAELRAADVPTTTKDFDELLKEHEAKRPGADQPGFASWRAEKDKIQAQRVSAGKRGKDRRAVRPSRKAVTDEEAFLADAKGFVAKAEARVEQLTKKWHEAPAPTSKASTPAPKQEGTPGVDPGVFEGRPVETPRGPRPEDKARPKLPVFSQGGKPTRIWTAADFVRAVTAEYRKPDVHPLGYDIGPSEGFRRMEDSAEQSVEDLKYVVRNKAGDVIGDETTFSKALELALKRQLDGDSIWYDGTRRRVAQWGTKRRAGADEPVFSADYWFASDVERRLVQRARQTDPRAVPIRLRQLMYERELRRAKRAAQKVGGKILDLTTAAPVRLPVPAKGRPADVVRKVAQLAATDLVGSDVLKQLPGGALVSPRDHRRILDEAQKAIGLTTEEAARIIESGGKLTDEQLAAIRAVAPHFDGPLTPIAYSAIHRSAVRQVGGALADVRYRVQGILPLGEQLMRAAKDFHLQRWAPGTWRRWAQETIPTPVQWLGKGFTGDTLARMPAHVAERFKALRTTLERNADETMELLKQEIAKGPTGRSSEDVLMSVIRRYPVVRGDALDVADAVVTTPTATTKAALLDHLRREWHGPRPAWLDDPEDLIAVAGARTWARDARNSAADIARDWIHANAVAAGLRVGPGDDLGAVVARLTTDELLPVYREVMLGGKLNGAATTDIAARLGFTPAKGNDALVGFLLRIRAKEAVAETVDELVGMGGVVRSNDVRLPALRSLLDGTAYQVENGRRVYKHTEAQTAWAEARLEDWGIQPGAGNAMKSTQLGRQTVTAPAFVADELASIARSGVLEGGKLEGMSASVLQSKFMRYFKESVTHGLLAPHPSYFLGQLMGMLPTLVTTRGIRGAADAISAPLFRHPTFVGELARRSGGVSLPLTRPRNPEALVLRTDSGSLIGVEEMEEAIRRHGLNETRPAFETQANIGQLLAAHDRPWWDPRRLAKPAKWWQETIRKYSGAVDLHARLGAFVDNVSKGMELDAAALAAKRDVLDFRDLTPFERQYMRLGITFYAFLRKNADAHVRALLTNPARVLGQMRLAHASLEQSGLTGVELGAMRDQDVGRFAFANDEDVRGESGNRHPFYRLNRITSPPVSVAEFLMQLRMVASPLTGSEQGITDLLGATTPLLQALAIGLLGRKLDREFETAGSNRVPPVLMDLWGGPAFRDAFGIGPEPLSATDDPGIADADATMEAGVPARWVAGASSAWDGKTPLEEWQKNKRKHWQLATMWLARDIAQAQQVSEALGFRPPAPYMTQTEAARDVLLGIKTRPVLGEREAVRRAQARKVADLTNATQGLRPPDGVGPR